MHAIEAPSTTPISPVTRKGLLLDPGGHVAEALRKNGFSGWEFQQVVSVDAAKDRLCSQGILVGLVAFDRLDAYRLADVEKLTAFGRTEWVALFPPPVLEDVKFRAFVLRNFHDYHTLPLDKLRLQVTVGHAYGKALMKQGLGDTGVETGRFGMIGRSPVMREIYRQIDKIVKVDAAVLIGGESGTGKELVARAIHQFSSRAAGPFVAMNCAALPPNLIQSALFGHEKGSFTDAHERRIGSIEAAHGGVLFLDEIGDLPLELQANLLRFLEEKAVVRLGSTRHVPVDVRVVAATHVDLQKAVAGGHFREDLYYRLNVLQIRMPALRERPEDVELLANHFFRAYTAHKNTQLKGFSEEALQAMKQYAWPGNVRELINRVHQGVIMSDNRLITPADLGLAKAGTVHRVTTLEHARAHTEREIIVEALHKTRNNISWAARELGVSRVTLYRLINKLNIEL